MAGAVLRQRSRRAYTAPGGRIQVVFFPAEHDSPDATWLLIERLSSGRSRESLSSWNTPAPVLAAYLFTASQPR